jgi:hypothetical protein
MRTRALLIPWVVAALAVFIVAFVISPVRTLPKADAAGPPSPSLIPVATNPAEEQVPTTFHTEQRQPLQAPVELRSANRQLRTAFTVEPTTFTVVLTVQTNQTQMLRLANIGADIWYRLKLSGS